MATYISKEKCLSFPVLLSQKGRLPAQPNFYLGTSNLGFNVCKRRNSHFFISVFCYTRPLPALLEAGAVSGAVPPVIPIKQNVTVPVALHINKAIMPPK